MQGHWERRQIRQAVTGTLLFTPEQAKLIQAEAQTRMRFIERRSRASFRQRRPIVHASVHLASKTGHFHGYFQRLSRIKAIESSRFMERAMGIEPTSEAWEVLNIPIPFSSQRHARPPRV